MNVRCVTFVAIACTVLLASLAAKPAFGSDLEFGAPIPINGPFRVPTGLAVDTANDKLLVVDTGHHDVKWTALNTVASGPTWTDFGGVADLTLAEALREPQATAVDAVGHVYVVDTHSNEVQLYRYDSSTDSYSYDPTFAQTTRNSVDGTNLNLPRDIAVASDGSVFLLDSGNSRILVASGPDDDSWAVWRADTSWTNAYGLDVRDDGAVLLADTGNHRILILPDATAPAIEIGSYGTRIDQFRSPRDVAVAASGRFFVADAHNHRITIYREASAPWYPSLPIGAE